MEKAIVEPEWKPDEVGLEASPFMETILFADTKICVLHANTAKESQLNKVPAGAPKNSWPLYMLPAHEAAAGGP